MNVNMVTIAGRLTKDVELRHTASEIAVCNLGVATTMYVKDGDDKTEFSSIVVWGKQAENCAKYLEKGQVVLVTGRLETRSWDNKETGAKQYATEIVAQNVQFGQKAGAGVGQADKIKKATENLGF